MKKFLEMVLHREIQVTTYADKSRLPLAYRSEIDMYILSIDGQQCLLIVPKENMPLPWLRKCYRLVAQKWDMPCALYMQTLNYYAKDILLQEGIPFVWEGRQLYLPFMGILLNSQDNRQLKPCVQISFATQRLLLTALYESWNGVSVSQAAEAMQVSKMTITRCFDEIEVLELPILRVKSRARKLYADPDKKNMWQIIKPVLRNPVIRTFRLSEVPQAWLPASGISALAEYSMLADNSYPTVAFEKKQIKELNIAAWLQVPAMEQPVCIAQEVGYILPFDERNAIDPLSVTLMLTDEDRSDPRIETSVNEMLEEYVW